MSATQLVESVQSSTTPYHVSAVAEVPPAMYTTTLGQSLYAEGCTQPLDGLSEMATHHTQPTRKFMCLSAKGITVYSKQRAIELLRDNLCENSVKRLSNFFAHFGADEACAMCVVIACARAGPEVGALQVSPVNGAAPGRQHLGWMGDREMVTDSRLAAAAVSALFTHGSARPSVQSGGSGVGRSFFGASGSSFSAPGGQTFNLSPRARGMERHLSRLLRPLWRWTIFTEDPKTSTRLRYRREQIVEIMAPLRRFREFIRENWARLTGADLEGYGILARDEAQNKQREAAQSAQQSENEHVRMLTMAAERCLEAMEVLCILGRRSHDLPETLKALSDKECAQLRELTFARFISDEAGAAIGRTLLQAQMRAFPHDAEDVQKLCAGFFNDADFVLFKADGALEESKRSYEHLEKREHLQAQARKAYIDAATMLGQRFPMRNVARAMRAALFHGGAVTVALRVGLQLTELQRRRGDEPLRDDRGACTPMSCFDEIFRTFDELLRKVIPGKTDPNFPFVMSDADRKSHIEQMKRSVMRMAPAHVKTRLFQWFVDNNAQDELYSMRSAADEIQSFLSSRTAEDPRCAAMLQQFYVKNEMFPEAAQLMLKWGDMGGDSRLPVEERVKRLTDGLLYADNPQCGERDEGLRQRIGDLVRIGTVQIDVLKEIRREIGKPKLPAQYRQKLSRAETKLQHQVVDIKPLFDVCNEFGMFGLVLRVLDLIHTEEKIAIVKETWEKIIEDVIHAWNASREEAKRNRVPPGRLGPRSARRYRSVGRRIREQRRNVSRWPPCPPVGSAEFPASHTAQLRARSASDARRRCTAQRAHTSLHGAPARYRKQPGRYKALAGVRRCPISDSPIRAEGPQCSRHFSSPSTILRSTEPVSRRPLIDHQMCRGASFRIHRS
eukprot:634909_1